MLEAAAQPMNGAAPGRQVDADRGLERRRSHPGGALEAASQPQQPGAALVVLEQAIARDRSSSRVVSRRKASRWRSASSLRFSAIVPSSTACAPAALGALAGGVDADCRGE